MLVDIYLIEPYQGVNAGQYTQVTQEVADQLIAEGKADKNSTEKQTKTETKKTGK